MLSIGPHLLTVEGIRKDMTFKPGASMLLRVIKKEQTGWKVHTQGGFYLVKSQLDLKIGAYYRVKVLYRGDQILLKIDAPLAASLDSLMDYDINDPLVRGIIEAFQREGLPLDPDKIAWMQKFLIRLNRKDPVLIRFLTILLDKGFTQIFASIDLFFLAVSGHGFEQRKKENRRQQDGKNTKQQQKKKLATAIKRQFTSWKGRPETLLLLFNHLKGSRNHWIVLPFDVQQGETDLSGSLRLLLDRMDGKPLQLSLLVNSGAVAWSFRIKNLQETQKTLSLACNMPNVFKKVKPQLDYLQQRLKTINVAVDPEIASLDNFDGFSHENSEIIEGIDRFI